MPPIRNSCVARGGPTGTTEQTLYTIPSNTVLLLKSIGLFNTNTTAQVASLYLKLTGGTFGAQLFSQSIAYGTEYWWSGWVALNATDIITLGSPGGGLYWWISGALLPSIPGF